MTEIFKDIPNYEGLYQVSNLGRVKSLKTSKILSNKRCNKGGYIRHILRKNNVTKEFCVHKLVALTFIPNPEHKPQVDHINTNVKDNRVENLKWVTQKENNNNPLTLINALNRPRKRAIIRVEDGKKYVSVSEAIRDMKTYPVAMYNSLKNNIKINGFTFNYTSE